MVGRSEGSPTPRANEEQDIIEKLHNLPITLIDKDLKLTLEAIQELADGQDILICDTNVDDIARPGQEIIGGYKQDNIMVIDHHFKNDARFTRQISSTNLAIESVLQNGTIPAGTKTIINHTDCDSILSSAIMRGLLEPTEEFGQAAIAADHTGVPNRIADLLQALDQKRDIEMSLRNLQLLLSGKAIEPEAQALLEKRYAEREKALKLVEEVFRFSPSGKVAYVESDERIAGELLPALLPSAEVIIIVSPRSLKGEDGQRLPGKQAKVRLGIAAPDGTDLRHIMKHIDAKWGGRWNAGSNDHNGGMDYELEDYAAKIEATLN